MRHMDEGNVAATEAKIHFLCQLFDSETLATHLTHDFRQAVTYLLQIQTTLKGNYGMIEEYGKEMLPFFEMCLSTIGGRRLFMTNRQLVGMGTQSILSSDHVWLIRDSLVPLILRPAEDTGTFVLVGEAYLHGFMYGEMLNPRWVMEEKTRTVINV
jgi:hypothetical protein